ncbi:hypothetical protein BAX95_14560 [Elizabethkingia meningoseptica]|uniref:hypothetical protein n=1 Tax=Elizabethkingia meningoseptica TaxID=238 RepID=UPI000999FFEB|nr:hypothetical protein [Elizabethkingia meningoseptica]OPC17519.1 hypothetical protein BAX95_14560 [Elizabethkingia meningoseptica]
MSRVFSISFIFIFILSFGQNKFEYKDRHLPAKYVLKNNKDTIVTRIAAVWAFSKKHFDPSTYLGKATFVDENGNKTKVKEKDIQYLEIVDFDGDVKKYTSAEKFPQLEKLKDNLLKILYEGRMGLYRHFYIYNIYGNYSTTSYFIEKDKQPIDSGLFTATQKKLKERFANYPELLVDLEKSKTDEEVIALLKKYNNSK